MDLTKFTAKIVYIKNGQKVTTAGDEIVAIKDVKVENNILKASIASTQKIELFSVSLVYDRTMKDEELFYVNGYQSWTTSKPRHGTRMRARPPHFQGPGRPQPLRLREMPGFC